MCFLIWQLTDRKLAPYNVFKFSIICKNDSLVLKSDTSDSLEIGYFYYISSFTSHLKHKYRPYCRQIFYKGQIANHALNEVIQYQDKIIRIFSLIQPLH
jgi:hypothetical protein